MRYRNAIGLLAGLGMALAWLPAQAVKIGCAGQEVGTVPTCQAAGTADWLLPSGGSGGVSDHGALTGLTPDDDHPQYLTTARGDALYSRTTAFAAVAFTGAYSALVGAPATWPWSTITSKPTTLVGYGITDAATATQGAQGATAYGWGNHASAGYLTSESDSAALGALSSHASAVDPHPTYTTAAEAAAAAPVQSVAGRTGAVTLALGDVSGVTPAAIGAATTAQGALADSASQPGHTQPWSTITSTPTTLAGYGVPNGGLVTVAHGNLASGLAVDMTTTTDVHTGHLTGSGLLTITLPSGSTPRTVRLDLTSDTGARALMISSAVTPSWAYGIADNMTPPAGTGVSRSYWLVGTASSLTLSAVTSWPPQ